MLSLKTSLAFEDPFTRKLSNSSMFSVSNSVVLISATMAKDLACWLKAVCS